MRLESPALTDGQAIPKKYTEDGENLSPPLRWREAPSGVAAYALVVDDPDAPRDEPWVHWLMYDIPAAVMALPEGVERGETPREPAGARQGLNSWTQNNLGYRGPAPPHGHGVHHYHFRIYALDRPLNLEARITKGALLKAMQGRVLEEAELVGTYERK